MRVKFNGKNGSAKTISVTVSRWPHAFYLNVQRTTILQLGPLTETLVQAESEFFYYYLNVLLLIRTLQYVPLFALELHFKISSRSILLFHVSTSGSTIGNIVRFFCSTIFINQIGDYLFGAIEFFQTISKHWLSAILL